MSEIVSAIRTLEKTAAYIEMNADQMKSVLNTIHILKRVQTHNSKRIRTKKRRR